MNCPHCGHDVRGKFCTGCGANVGRRDPEIHQTPHFRIHFMALSFAEQNMATIGTRLENAYSIITDLLGVDIQNAIIDVHLSELVVQFGGQQLGGGGYAVPSRMQIHDVYVPDAPGDGLERSLLVLLLALATGREHEPAPMFVDGLLARVMQRLGSFPSDEQIAMALTDSKARGEMPSVPALLPGPSTATQSVYYPASAAFIGFLMRTYGIEKVKEFIAGLDPRAPDQAAQMAFKQSISQLDKAWSKTIKSSKSSGMWRFIRQSGGYLKPYKVKVAEIVVYIGVSVAFTIGMAKMQGYLVDKALVPRDKHALAVIMGILVGSFIVVSVMSLRQSYLTAFVSESVLKTMRMRMFSLLQRMHPGYFQNTRTGDLMSRMTSDVAAVQFALTGSMAQGFRMLLTLVAAVVTIYLTDWKLATIGLLGTPLFFISTRWLGPAAARASKERQRQLANSTSNLQENLSAQPVVKAFGLQDRMVADYDTSLNRVFRASIRLTYLTGIYSLSANTVATGINLTVMGVGAWLIVDGHLFGIQSNITIGTLFTFLGLMGQVIGPVQNLSSILQGFQQASGAMDRIEELIKIEPAIQDAPGARPIPPVTQVIQLENLSFGYTEAQKILNDLTLSIQAGWKVALVGPSGCGKSTILNMIMRFYDPDGGRVTFDGVDIRDATLDSVRGQMGVVFQDNVLFNISVRENIRLGNLNATDEEVEGACQAAEIHELIMSMPDQYDTLVGERGGRLSGGQRQRVAIARAILRNPAILILDEATSALDPRTEAAINETLERIGRGRTTISVTHRLSSTVNMDRIFVLDRGQLVEMGTHQELLQKGGLYANLWQEQGGGHVRAGQPATSIPGGRESLLQSVPIFAALEPRLLSALAQHLSVQSFSAGDTIITAGEMGDKLYIIHRGQVEVLGNDPIARERRLATLREGDHFGEMALLQEGPRTATVRATTPLEVFTLSKMDFNGLLAAVPQLRALFEQIVSQRAQAQRPHRGQPAMAPAAPR